MPLAGNTRKHVQLSVCLLFNDVDVLKYSNIIAARSTILCLAIFRELI